MRPIETDLDVNATPETSPDTPVPKSPSEEEASEEEGAGECEGEKLVGEVVELWVDGKVQQKGIICGYNKNYKNEKKRKRLELGPCTVRSPPPTTTTTPHATWPPHPYATRTHPPPPDDGSQVEFKRGFQYGVQVGKGIDGVGAGAVAQLVLTKRPWSAEMAKARIGWRLKVW